MTQPTPRAPLGPISTPAFRAGRTLADAISLLARRFGAFALLQAVPFVALFGVGLLLRQILGPDAFDSGASPGAIALLIAFMLVLYVLPFGGMVAIGKGCYDELRGVRPSLGELLPLVFTRAHVVLGILVFSFLLLLGVSFFVGLLAMIPILGPIVATGLLLFFALGLFVTFPVVGIERLGPVASMQRSWELVTNNRLRILGALLLLVVISTGLWLAWFFGFGYDRLGDADEFELSTASTLVVTAIMFIVSLLGACLAGSAYYHLRRAAGEAEAEDVAAVFE